MMPNKQHSEKKTPIEGAAPQKKPAAEDGTPSQNKTAAEGTQRSDGSSNYVVGYRRPPVHSRFTKGHRSRGGRPKGQRNVRTVLRGFANERITITAGDRLRNLTKRDALLLSLLNRGVAGDDKAVGRVLPMLEAEEDAEAIKQQDFTTNDQAVIEDFLRRRGVAMKPEGLTDEPTSIGSTDPNVAEPKNKESNK
jgi:hypothetical protein